MSGVIMLHFLKDLGNSFKTNTYYGFNRVNALLSSQLTICIRHYMFSFLNEGKIRNILSNSPDTTSLIDNILTTYFCLPRGLIAGGPRQGRWPQPAPGLPAWACCWMLVGGSGPLLLHWGPAGLTLWLVWGGYIVGCFAEAQSLPSSLHIQWLKGMHAFNNRFVIRPRGSLSVVPSPDRPSKCEKTGSLLILFLYRKIWAKK